MGSAIARRLSEQGIPVFGWNRTPSRSENLVGVPGLTIAATAEEAIANSDAVVLVLSDASAIESTLFPESGLDLTGRLVIQMGTIAPEESRAISERLSAGGAGYLEAPVLGSLPEAREGRLIIMAGGDPAVFARCRPILGALSVDPRHIGPVGQGAALKLAMNQLIAGLTACFSLSLGMVRAEGIEIDQFMDLLRSSALYAPTFDKKLAKYKDHTYGQANFPLKHLLKDVRLFERVADPLGLDTGPISAVARALVEAIAMGYADQDYSALYEALVPSR